MAQKISTEELIDEYFKRKTKNEELKRRSQIDKPALYEYEKEIKKKLTEMNEEELIGLLNFFIYDKAKKGGNNYAISTLIQISSIFRKIFIFYDEKYEPISNPWLRKSMRKQDIKKRLNIDMSEINHDRFLKAIKLIEKNYDENRTIFLKAIIFLAYEGLCDPKEVPQICEGDISFTEKTIYIKERDITLNVSEECLNLLKKVHEMLIIENDREKFEMLSWKGSYFKFPLKAGKVIGFQDRDLSQLSYMLAGQLNRYVTNSFSINMKFRNIYILGLYEKLVSIYGKQNVNDFILSSTNNKIDNNNILETVNKYGYLYKDTIKLKDDMMIIKI